MGMMIKGGMGREVEVEGIKRRRKLMRKMINIWHLVGEQALMMKGNKEEIVKVVVKLFVTIYN